LEGLVKQGSFRSDLFFRLSIMPVFLPPLREREGDIELLVQGILADLAQQHGLAPCSVDAPTLRRLEQHAWPGNVRELSNVLQRAVLLHDGDSLTLDLGGFGTQPEPTPGEADATRAPCDSALSFHHARALAVADFEARFVRSALAASEGNVSLAARQVGKERRSFGRLLKKYGIDRANFASAA
jgi:DNA-binding NtrC family response regulator